MNLSRLLENTAKRIPRRTGLRFEGESYTYQELDTLTNRMAGGLAAAGLRPGDRCILMMPSCPEFIIVYYALAKMGVVIIPVNFLYKSHELSHIFRDSEARGFIGMEPYLKEPGDVFTNLPQPSIRIASGVEPGSDFIPLESLAGADSYMTHTAGDDDPLAIFYTSGTTGLPKGAVLSHKNLYSNAVTVADMRTTGPDDIVIGALPLYHIYGQTSLLNASIYLGLNLHLFRQFDPKAVISLIENAESTILIAVPTMLNRLLLETDRIGIERSSLRFCISGGASLPVEVLNKFQERFMTVIYEGYGLTECSPVCVENPFGGKTKPGSIGLPIPGFKVRIVNDLKKDLAPGHVGELIVQGPGVMKGYLNEPEETARTVMNGWLHTGDMARMDEDGYIYVVDRVKDMIVCGGYNIYPKEIEMVLYSHPAVLEAAVVQAFDDVKGEIPKAFIVLKPGQDMTGQEMNKFCRENLAPYKVPRLFEFVDELPKTVTGKIRKVEIRQRD